MRDWVEPLSPPLSDMEGQGPQDGPRRLIVSLQEAPGFFTFTFSFSMLANAFRCSPRYRGRLP